MPYDYVYQQAIASLIMLKWKIIYANEEEGIIQAKTPFSIWTSGDLITIQLSKAEKEIVKINMVSSSSQKYDWGKNEKNIIAFYSEMQKPKKLNKYKQPIIYDIPQDPEIFFYFSIFYTF